MPGGGDRFGHSLVVAYIDRAILNLNTSLLDPCDVGLHFTIGH